MGGVHARRRLRQSPAAGWRLGQGRRPAIYVSYDDAKAYVEWLRQKSGKAYRLLSESEWEFAARGGTNTPFAGGETLAPTQANFDASTAAGGKKQGSYEGKSVEAGTFPPNPYGLHDMEGNVFEWVEDCWNPTHEGAPADASPRGGDCKRRVAKGGAWYYEAEFARPSARMSFPKGSRLNVIYRDNIDEPAIVTALDELIARYVAERQADEVRAYLQAARREYDVPGAEERDQAVAA